LADSRLTPISRPLVKGTNLLRPVVESRRRATVSDNRRITAFPFNAVFVSSAGFHPDVGGGPQHLLRLKLRVGEARGSLDPRGLETHSGPYAGLLKGATSPERVRYLQARGRGSASGERRPRRERASHQRHGLPDLWLMIDGSSRSAAYVYRADRSELGPDWLELDVWLARSLLRYAARNFSIENTVPRDSM
jgi:hypothetical protein